MSDNERTTSPDTRGTGDELHQGVSGGNAMTTSQGIPVTDDQNQLRAGDRGPFLRGQVRRLLRDDLRRPVDRAVDQVSELGHLT